MSPLLGSSGGSSEYAYRGTLDDWPNPFATTLSGQDILGTQSPTTSATGIVTAVGLNYKARVIVENNDATISTDGGLTYVSARSADASVFIRDNTTIRIRLQPTSGTLSDFNKSYTIPVKIGKREGTWTVSTRSIDETPNSFILNGLIDQQLGITTISNTVTIVGLETGFSFPISVSANQPGTPIEIYKNGALIGVSGTVANNDQIYLSTQTPNSYATTRTFTAQVGTFTTTWGLITRNAVVGVNPFSFVGVSSANVLGVAYTSASITLSGADAGPTDPTNPASWPSDPTRLPVSISGPNAFYEIRKSDDTLRYTDPVTPTSSTYFQNVTNFAFNGDKIKVRINSSSSYNTTVVGILTVSTQSSSYSVTTRPTPIDTVPATFTFTDLTNQGRGALVTSSPITLSGMSNGASDFGIASIVLTGTTANITPQFEVNSSGTWISPPTTASVKNGDQIRLRMITPILSASNGVTNANLQFRVDGTDTTINLPLEGFNTINAFNDDIWTVGTIARTCPITTFIIPNQSSINLNTDVPVDFTVGGYNTDCQMNVTVTSDSSAFNFTQLNGAAITPAKTLTNVTPGSTVRLTARSSPSYITGVASTITVSNSASGVTPSTGFNTSFTITTVADTTPWTLSLTASPTTIEVGSSTTLTWSSTNCTSIRSINWTATPPISLSGTTTQTLTTTGPITFTITAYVNTASSTYTTGTAVDGPTGIRYATASVTITVNEDYTPTLNPSAVLFSSLTGVEPSTAIPNLVSSGIVTVTGITAAITGSVTGSPGSSGAAFALPVAGSITNSNIVNNTNIQLRVNASTDFLTTTSAFINFTDPSANSVAAQREFRVTTRECIPEETSFQWPVGPVANSVTLIYYTNAQFTNTLGTIFLGETLLKSRPPTGLVATGTATAYYNSILAGSGNFQGSTTPIQWADLVSAIWDAFTLNAQRPPAQFEIEALLSTFNPSNYTGITSGITPWQPDLNASATGNVNRIRSTTTPILNSCTTRTATVGTIKTGAY